MQTPCRGKASVTADFSLGSGNREAVGDLCECQEIRGTAHPTFPPGKNKAEQNPFQHEVEIKGGISTDSPARVQGPTAQLLSRSLGPVGGRFLFSPEVWVPAGLTWAGDGIQETKSS